MMREWRLTIIVVIFALLVASVGIYFVMSHQRMFVAQSQVLVVKRGGNGNPQFQQDHISTQSAVIRSQSIAERTVVSEPIQKRLATTGFRSYPDVKKPADLVDKIMLGLSVVKDNKVAGPKNTGVLTVTFRAADADEAKLILVAVIDSYQQFIDETYGEFNEAIVKQNQVTQAELEKTIKQADSDPKLAGDLQRAKDQLAKVNGLLKEAEMRKQSRIRVSVVVGPTVYRQQ